MAPSDPSATRVWLEESAWVQRLARRLVRESAQAEDLAQEALRVALENPPAASVPFRSWLGGVVRNLARVARRGDARRQARELATARTEALEGSERLAERLEIQERLVAAVRGLDEPYRTTVALRYLEDLSTPDVAARLNVPVKTVHTRLERALAQLRERLDREHGSRAAWAGLLVPLSVPPPSAPLELAGPAVAVPLVAMGTATKWTAATVTLAVLGFFAFRTLENGPARARVATEPEPERASAPLVRAEPLVDSEASPAALRESTAPSGADVSRETPAPPTASSAVVGYVLDIERRPMAGLAVSYEGIDFGARGPREGTDATAESAADGRFELPDPSAPSRIVARGRGFATLRAPTLAGPRSPEPPLVFVGPERSYSGIVVDVEHRPVAGAELGIYVSPELGELLTPKSIAASLSVARTVADENGHFAFASVGFAEGSHLSFAAEGFRPAKVELPAASSSDLELVLERKGTEPGSYAGRVVHADGTPAQGAYVSSGQESVRADAEGRFTLSVAEDQHPTHVRAALRGFLPAELELAFVPEEQRDQLELVLGGAGLSIHGRVVDRDGQPVAGARVWTEDGQHFGDVLTQAGEVSFAITYDVEGILDGIEDGQADKRDVRTGTDGSFELAGLVARRYRLWAMHGVTFERLGPLEVSAGAQGVELVLAGEETLRRVAGRALDYGGRALAGVSVRVGRRYRGEGGRFAEHRDYRANTLVTDAEGRFAYERLCVDGTTLYFTAKEGVSEVPLELARVADLEAVEVRLPAVCHLRLVLEEPERAKSLQLLDADGKNLFLMFQLGGVLCSATAVQITNGATELITTDESAATLVLSTGIEEVERIPITLEPGRVNEFRL